MSVGSQLHRTFDNPYWISLYYQPKLKLRLVIKTETLIPVHIKKPYLAIVYGLFYGLVSNSQKIQCLFHCFIDQMSIA